MKYLKYVSILLWSVIRKVIGIPITLAMLPFRKYANNVVFNYALANKLHLKRLYERPIVQMGNDYIIYPYHGTEGGKIALRDVSKLEYLLVYYVIWQWLDADSNHDTFDAGYIGTIISGERFKWMPSFLINVLKNEIKDVPYGNSFDIGDDRVVSWKYKPFSTLLWSIRNTAYNSKYMTHEKKEGDPDIWYATLFDIGFGWKQDDTDKSNYSIVYFGVV